MGRYAATLPPPGTALPKNTAATNAVSKTTVAKGLLPRMTSLDLVYTSLNGADAKIENAPGAYRRAKPNNDSVRAGDHPDKPLAVFGSKTIRQRLHRSGCSERGGDANQLSVVQ